MKWVSLCRSMSGGSSSRPTTERRTRRQRDVLSRTIWFPSANGYGHYAPWTLLTNRSIIAPSLLAGDFSQLGEDARRVEAAGADWLHLDVMDGHFVDNISFGPAVVAAMKKAVKIPLDVHLMISRPDHYLPRFVEAGARSISVHLEAKHDVAATLRAIREAGCLAGLAINPGTSLSACDGHLAHIDLLLVMTVNPGFGGQAFIPRRWTRSPRGHAARGEGLEVPHRSGRRHQGGHGQARARERRERDGRGHVGVPRRGRGGGDPGAAGIMTIG